MIRTTTCALLLLVLPGGIAAQQVQISSFTARDAGLRGSASLVGLSAMAFSGPVGFRLGGAVDALSTPLAGAFRRERSDAIGAWSADADLVLSGARAGVRFGSVEPSVFTGFGVHGLRHSDGTTSTIPVWSYGGSLSMPLAGWVSLDGGARYRMPHESDVDRLPPDVAGGWEVRAGLSLRLGRSARRARPARTVRPAGTWHIGRNDVSEGARSSGSARSLSEARPAGTAGPVAVAEGAIRTADLYVGVPYVWGGNTPEQGFDCSGFVRYVYALNGIDLPRVSRDQARAGVEVSTRIRELREGDLLFFAGSDGRIDHVALYVGGGRIIHAASSRGEVAYDDLGSRRARWYATHLVAARRVIPDGVGVEWGSAPEELPHHEP